MAEQCYICGIESGKAFLFDAIYDGGIVKICENCSKKEDVPLIKSGGEVNVKESSKNKSTYDRLSEMAGIDPKEHREKFGKKSQESEKQEQNLRKVVEEKSELAFPKLEQVKAQKKEDLVRNFHWTIFQARRAMKMSQKNLAEKVSEPEKAIRLSERGILPDDYRDFVRKIQMALGVTLFKKPDKKKRVGFDPATSKSVTIGDLREREKQESQEDPGEEEGEKPKKVPFWKRILNKLKGKKKEHDPLEVPEDEDLDFEEETVSVRGRPEKDKELEHPESTEVDSTKKDHKEESSSEDRGSDEQKKSNSKNSKGEPTDEEIDKIVFGGK